MRAGAALVVTDVGDIGALVRQHQLGTVAVPGDPAALAAAMQDAARAERTSWRANTRQLAQKFSVPGAVRTFLDALGAAAPQRTSGTA